MMTNDEIDNGRITSRLHKTWPFATCGWGCNIIFTPTRKLVSRSKRRYVDDEFDLDLTMVTPRIIVHGFPAIGLEHIYRNPRGEILRFMDHYHKDHYKMYNFCCEYGRSYDPAVFHGRVERYPFKDHNTPPLNTMHAFANSGKAFLDADPMNVVNMHCKAGKGRAGLMCCVMLVRSGACQSAKDAMALYDKTRVTNNKGLTVTSQRKFVIFYELLWRKFWKVTGNIGDIPADSGHVVPPEPELQVYGVEVHGTKPGALKNMSVHLYRGTNMAPVHLVSVQSSSSDQHCFDVDTKIQGNFKIRIDHKPGMFKAKKAFEMWHNTLFIEDGVKYMDFGLDQIDLKRKFVKKFGEGVTIRVKFTKDRLPAPTLVANAAGGVDAEGVELVVREGADNNVDV